MSLRFRNLLVSCGFTALFALAPGAHANDLPYGKSAQTRANAKCSVYGPGFVAAEGSDTCIWVGGHVRLEFGSRSPGSPNNGWASGGAVPAAMRVQDSADSRGHLRLQDGDVTGSIQAR
jgi:hypothetical protein